VLKHNENVSCTYFHNTKLTLMTSLHTHNGVFKLTQTNSEQHVFLQVHMEEDESSE
jgi:hypothetical protein